MKHREMWFVPFVRSRLFQRDPGTNEDGPAWHRRFQAPHRIYPRIRDPFILLLLSYMYMQWMNSGANYVVGDGR